MSEQMRKDFERWARKNINSFLFTEKDALAWEAWQAALATQPQAPQEVVKDAERYQWLRKSHPEDDVGIFVSKESLNGWGRTVAKILRNAELDQAIDKARAAAPKEPK